MTRPEIAGFQEWRRPVSFSKTGRGAMPRIGILVLLLVAVALIQPANASPDALWLVSVRRVFYQSGAAAAPDRYDLYRFDERDRTWQRANLDQFEQSGTLHDSTVLYVHGNRISHQMAFCRGWDFFHALRQAAVDQTAWRAVIFSWPADQIPRQPVRDVRVKAARVDPAARHLGRFMSVLVNGKPVTLVGYSYGAPIIAGALQRIGGESADAATAHGESRQVRAVLLSAAMPQQSLLPERKYGRAIDQTETTLSIYNGCDRILSRYHLLDRCCGEPALGYAGLPWTSSLGTAEARFQQLDASESLGTTHDAYSYFHNPHLMARIAEAAAADAQ